MNVTTEELLQKGERNANNMKMELQTREMENRKKWMWIRCDCELKQKIVYWHSHNDKNQYSFYLIWLLRLLFFYASPCISHFFFAIGSTSENSVDRKLKMNFKQLLFNQWRPNHMVSVVVHCIWYVLATKKKNQINEMTTAIQFQLNTF